MIFAAMMRSMDSRTYVDNDHAAALDTTPQLQQGQAATQDNPAVALPHSAPLMPQRNGRMWSRVGKRRFGLSTGAPAPLS